MELKNGLLDFFFKIGKEERDKIGESDTYFMDKLSDQEKEQIVSTGELFMKKTDIIRADFYYSMKDAILDPNNEEFAKFDARSLNFMLDRIVSFDVSLIEQIKENLTNEEKQL